MRIITQGMNLPLILREDGVGASVQKICYPAISSCITITCVGTAGIAGAHLTVLTTAAQLAETIQSLRSSGIGAYKVCYVIGAIRHFKTYVKEGAINTRKKISTALESALGGPSRPLFTIQVPWVRCMCLPRESWSHVIFLTAWRTASLSQGSTTPLR